MQGETDPGFYGRSPALEVLPEVRRQAELDRADILAGNFDAVARRHVLAYWMRNY